MKAKIELVIIAIIVFVGLSHVLPYVFATSPNPPWCHCEPNGNCQTIYVAQSALINAGHTDANGSPLHAGDHAGECVAPTATPTPTPSVTPTATPTGTPTFTPTPTPISECQDCVTPTPTPSPTDIPRQTPTPTPPTDPGTPPQAAVVPLCGAKPVEEAVTNPHVYRSGDMAVVKWWPTAGESANVYYKEVQAPEWQHSKSGPNNGYMEISGLGTLDVTFGIQQVDGCGGGVTTNIYPIVDGPTTGWVLFR